MESIRIFHKGLSGDMGAFFHASSTKMPIEHPEETRIGSLMLMTLQERQEKNANMSVDNNMLVLNPSNKTNV